jgi:hypothetical protein
LSEHQQPNENRNPQWLDKVLLETVQGIELDDSPTVEEQLTLDLYKESAQLIRPYEEIDTIKLSLFGSYVLDANGVVQLEPNYHEMLLTPVGDTEIGVVFECPDVYSEYSEPTRVIVAGSLFTARHEPFTVGGARMLSSDGWPVAERGAMVESVIEDCPGVIVHKQISTMGRLAFYFTYCREEIERLIKEEPEFQPEDLTPVGIKKGGKQLKFYIPDYISVHPGVVVGISTTTNSGNTYEQGIFLKPQTTS